MEQEEELGRGNISNNIKQLYYYYKQIKGCSQKYGNKKNQDSACTFRIDIFFTITYYHESLVIS